MTEIVQRIAAFFDILSSRNVLIEIGAVALCLLAGWFAGTALRGRYERRRFKTPTALTWTYFASQGSVVIKPVTVALLIVMLAHGVV